MRLVLHPFVAHFPIAFLLLNYALTLAFLRRGDPFLERAAYGALVIGWWSAFAAIATGSLDLALNWPLRSDVVNWINAHAGLSFVLLYVYGRALLLRKRNPDILRSSHQRQYLFLLSLGALLVLVIGWIGGHLVHGLGFGIDVQ